MRIAFLIDELHGAGHKVRSGALMEELKQAGHDAYLYSGDALVPNLLIVDSYDERARMGAINHRLLDGIQICFIDDYGGPLNTQTNFIVNGSIPLGLEYDQVVGQTVLFGPQYCLLRPEFRDLPPHEIRPKVERILVTMGGSPEGQELAKQIAQNLAKEMPGVEMVIPFGGTDAMLDSMSHCDIAICSAGMSLYECLAAGLPTVAIQTADNQRHNLDTLCPVYAMEALSSNVGYLMWPILLMEDPDIRQAYSLRGQQLIDGYGTQRVRVAIEKMFEGVR